MQEEIENRTVNLAISTTKLSIHEAMKGIKLYLDHRKNKTVQRKNGKQTLKQLLKKDQGATNIEIAKDELKGFERIARKYGIDYAVTKDISNYPPRFLIFFKAKDTDALNAAYKEYATRAMKVHSRPSILKQLAHLKEVVLSIPKKVRNKEHTRNDR